jgi:hypothetical protein
MVRDCSDLGPGASHWRLAPLSHGATAIPVELTKAVRAAALSLALIWGGASVLSAGAQDAAPALSAAAQKATPKPAQKAPPKSAQKTPQKSAPKSDPAFEQPIDEVDPNQAVSDAVIDVAAWVIASGDNRDLPFAVVDKDAAQLLVFGADGKLRGLAPALIGSAVGDDSAPGVAERELKDIPAADRTTPAGRYLAGYGPAVGGKKVLWVDYATAISIHALPATRASKKEKRKERLASPTPQDNRITHGCINVSAAFYTKIVSPIFKEGGVFYVLPDSAPLQTAFPGFEPLASPPRRRG